jgi:hypothetical protein
MNPDTPDDAEYLNSPMLPYVALAMMVTRFGVLCWLVDGSVGRYRALVLIGCCRISGLQVTNELILWGLIAGVTTFQDCRREFVALNIGKLVRPARRSAARLRSGRSVRLRALEPRFHGAGSMSTEMLRLRYITEKSEPASPFRSRIGQSACS